MLKAAAIQMNASDNKAENVAKALSFVKEAIKNGARFITLPEVFNYRGPLNKKNIDDIAEKIPGESLRPLMDLAKTSRVFILAGSIYEKIPNQSKCYNTSILINDYGRLSAKYRKINLFEAVVHGQVIKESYSFVPGKTQTIGTVDFLRLGMTVCYDLRFAELYRKYAKKLCGVVAVPSAFTYQTGEAHWEVLLRARAIENLCYVIAPNQCGVSPLGVRAYGNSMIVDPWGGVIARASADKEEIIYANFQKEALECSRAILPTILK